MTQLRPRLEWLIVAFALTVGWGCSPVAPAVVIVTPMHGTFTTAPSVSVTGVVVGIDPSVIADVRVNGVSVPLAPNQTFTTTVALDAVAIANPIVAEVIGDSGSVVRDRVTVMAGDSVADGDFSVESVALQFTEAGLDTLEPSVASLVDFDLATLLPPGTLVINDFCYQDSFAGCLGRVDVTIHGAPPPSVASFAVDVDPQTNFAEGDVILTDMDVTAKVKAVTGVGFTCYIDIHSNTTNIFGDYGLSPDAIDPSAVDVFQLGGIALAFGGFSDSTDCDGFLGFIVEALISLFIGDVQDLMQSAIQNFLNTLDGNGNTPIAGAMETALAGVEISGPIGQALGVDLETPLFTVDETTTGITFGSDGRITASLPDPLAVDLLASYHVDELFPTFGTLAPNGMPYHMGLCVSTSTFNQLLKAETESGLLLETLTEFDFGSGPGPITAGLLSLVLPAFAVLDPSEVLHFQIRPTLAPIVTGDLGPGGELALVRAPHLLVTLVAAVDGTVLLQAAVDTEVGLDLTVAAGELNFMLGTPTAQDISFTILQNPLLANEAALETLLPALMSLAFPSIADSLGTFPLPAFLGFQLQLVDANRNGEFMSLFLDLAPAP
jgi:hypothetical protein